MASCPRSAPKLPARPQQPVSSSPTAMPLAPFTSSCGNAAGSTTGEVAARLNKRITSLGPTRANLISKGLIYSPDHGMVAYTVPAMAEFVRRQAAQE